MIKLLFESKYYKSLAAAVLLFVLVSCKKDDLPIANFSISTKIGAAQIEVQLINKSTNAVSYSWNVDGKTVSQDPNPEKLVYKGPRLEKILVTLEVTDKFGRKSTKTSDLEAWSTTTE